MKIFDNGILCLTEIHGLLNNPRDLTLEQFKLLCWFTNTGIKNIIECKSSAAAAIESGVFDSLSDVRRMIKANGFGIGKRKVTTFEDELSVDEFFETGITDTKWTTIKNGKKQMEVIIIVKDEFISDPWFGVTYDDWHKANIIQAQ